MSRHIYLVLISLKIMVKVELGREDVTGHGPVLVKPRFVTSKLCSIN